MTKDGVIGYVRNKFIKESAYKTLTSSFQAPEYTSQTRPGKINMVFHQVFNTDATKSGEVSEGYKKR